MRSREILRSAESQFLTDVSEQSIGPIFNSKKALTLENGTDRLFRNVGNKLPL